MLTPTHLLTAQVAYLGGCIAAAHPPSPAEALAPIGSAGKVYLLGTLEAPGVKPLPPTLEVAGDRVTLGCADPEILSHWGQRSLRNLDLTVQVRHPPGSWVPELATLGPGTPELHPLLSRWLGPSP